MSGDRASSAGAQPAGDAAAACEMHPAAVLSAARQQSVRRGLAQATARAAALGVRDVPAVAVGKHVFHGERALEEAAGHALALEPLAR